MQCNATQQSNTKDILKLKPKYNATQQRNTKDILKLKPKCNATQCNTTVQWEDMWEVP